MSTRTVPTTRRIVKAVTDNSRKNSIAISLLIGPGIQIVTSSHIQAGSSPQGAVNEGIVQSGSVRKSPAQSVREHLSSLSKSAEQLGSEFGTHHRSDQEHPQSGCVC